MTGQPVALVLSGGGAKTAAHVGAAKALAEAGHEIEEAAHGNAAIERLHEGSFDVVVSDLRRGGSTGIEVLKSAKALHPNAAVILMTAFGSVSTAVEAMKAGAFD